MKRCYKCGETKPRSEFNKNRSRPDGLQAACKPCHRAYSAKWAKENPDYVAKYRKENAENYRAYRAKWKRENPEKQRAYVAKWRKKNPEKNRAKRQRYRARKLAAIPEDYSFTAEELEQRLSMFPNCWICGGSPEAIDHVKPLAKGGLHVLANLRPICASCNRAKHARWPLDDQTLQEIRNNNRKDAA